MHHVHEQNSTLAPVRCLAAPAPSHPIRTRLLRFSGGLQMCVSWAVVVALFVLMFVSGVGLAMAIAFLVIDASEPRPRRSRR